jgi:hypothetical protein
MTFDADRPEDVLADALDARYAYSSPYDLADAWDSILESVTPAEAFSLGGAARTIGRGASRVRRDPAFGRALATAAPAVGTALGGPLGARIGSVAAARLAPAAAPGAPGAAATDIPPGLPGGIAGGSTAATQLLILLGQPAVQRTLLRLSLGEHGRRTPVNGVAVPDLIRALSAIAAQAAEDADGLYSAEDDADPGGGADYAPDHEGVYRAVIDAADAELAEAMG